MKYVWMTTVALAFAAAPVLAGQSPAPSAADKTFMTDTAHAGMAEVELGKLAAQNASSDQVKQFAQKMVDEHTKANVELKDLASKKNVSLPSDLAPQDKALHDKLSNLKGDAFDRQYMAAQVAGHRKVADEFRKESKSGADADVKAWAAKTLPTIEEHLKMAQDANRAVGTSGKK
jgi:putative membrane protein